MWIPRTRTPKYNTPSGSPVPSAERFDLCRWAQSLFRTATPRYQEGPPDGGWPCDDDSSPVVR